MIVAAFTLELTILKVPVKVQLAHLPNEIILLT
jgi:hypothetical protein